MWTCRKCTEKIDDTWRVCWKCGTSIDGIEDPSFQPEVAPPVAPLPPWITLWTSPRKTIRGIVDSDPKRHVITLALLEGFAGALEDVFGNTAYLALWGLSAPESTTSRALHNAFATPLTLTNLVTSLIFFPIGALIFLYLGGALLRWTGSWLGGQGSSVEVRAALAWSSLPLICASSLWIPEIALVATNPWSMIGFRNVGKPIIRAILGIWAFVMSLKCLGEVHRFSAWRALGAVLLGALVILVPVVSLWLLSGEEISRLIK